MSQRGGANLSFVLSGIGADVCTKRRAENLRYDVEEGGLERKKDLPVLKSSRKTTAVCILCCLCLLGSVACATAITTINLLDTPLAIMRTPPHSRNESVTDSAQIGLWDSQRAITKLQLQVAVSLALGVRSLDDDIHVRERESHFFTVVVDHTDTDELSFMKSSRFLNLLNVHLAPFGGLCVVSNDVVKVIVSI